LPKGGDYLYKVAGVRFKPVGKIYYFDPSDLELDCNSNVIVETARGIEFGKIVTSIKHVNEQDVVLPLKKVLRIANDADLEIVLKNKQDAKKDFANQVKRFKEYKMKLIDVEYTYDRSKLFFYFTAEGRIDFRELVKYLVSIYRTRVELRQVGVRDEAKTLGGIGPCGRVLCCSTFLGEFEPISIKMAKDQNLSLNPTKISGLCGRLMCCLKYEIDHYESGKANFPAVGTVVTISSGPAKVISVNIDKNTIKVQTIADKKMMELEMDNPEIIW
jgi:cell fate regulator YaaT (PSP1 superfamily)